MIVATATAHRYWQYPAAQQGVQYIFFTKNLAIFGGLLLASPFILFFISQFVSPALTDREMKAVKPLCISALFLFLLGSAFSFFLLMPSTVRIAIDVSSAPSKPIRPMAPQ